ncbi:hypothetical protein CKN94_10605 [Carnobacterium maltaromaticum]|nr:hypothetical protein CKN94_10605 [Carnobacterium maltaromaticum]TFJ77947.1 hypothetical protein CKN97_09915 [Carnobacterium maltaromaticum]CAD5902955.1 hypothetical protein CMALT394_570019 [Carnobacterium maltaromaticum]
MYYLEKYQIVIFSFILKAVQSIPSIALSPTGVVIFVVLTLISHYLISSSNCRSNHDLKK